MKKLYLQPELLVKQFNEDVITASVLSDGLDDYVYFDKSWLA